MNAPAPAPSAHLPRLAEIIGQHANLAPEHIQPAHDLFDLGIEGVELAAVVTDMQATWGIAVSDHEADRLVEVRDLLRLLDMKGAPVLPPLAARLDVLP
jgi:acyl carrier protein